MTRLARSRRGAAYARTCRKYAKVCGPLRSLNVVVLLHGTDLPGIDRFGEDLRGVNHV